jgi:bacillolysin
VLDGASRDYYPDRYVGILDNGGVHWNSGIGNLFFVLLVQGGTHPQQKTTNYVSPIGILPALDIIYDTLIHYLTSTSNFAATSSAMAVATKSLFPGDAAKLNSVTGAWSAVGVN